MRALGKYRVYHRKGEQEEEFDVRDDLSKLVSLARAFSNHQDEEAS